MLLHEFPHERHSKHARSRSCDADLEMLDWLVGLVDMWRTREEKSRVDIAEA